jgi:parallel beta-helix repeat protein
LNISSQWDLETIVIDNNWSATAIMYDWCEGTGTKNDPYIIKDVSFSIRLQDTSIIVRNTSEQFQIHGCIFYQCKNAIMLENVSNGVIINNNFTEYYSNAINLVKCHDVSISSNLLYDGQYQHITVESSKNVNITNNLIDTIGGTNYGILLENVNESRIEHNAIDFTSGYIKIALYDSNHNLIFNNSLINSGGDGLILYNSSRNTITNNTIKKCGIGIELRQESIQNELRFNHINVHYEGIFVRDYSHNNSIASNLLENAQITIISSNLNKMSFNSIRNPYIGIYLAISNNSVILNNTIYHYTDQCIKEYKCIYNEISGNICIPIPSDLLPFYTFLIVISVLGSAFLILFIYGRIRKILRSN